MSLSEERIELVLLNRCEEWSYRQLVSAFNVVEKLY